MDQNNQTRAGARKSDGYYRLLFEKSPIFLWEQDWSQVKQRLDKLSTSGIDDLPNYLQQHPKELHSCLKLVELTKANEATLVLLDAGDSPKTPTSLLDFIAPESVGELGTLLTTLVTCKDRCIHEVCIQTLSGKKIPGLLHFVVTPGHEESLDRILVALIDITKLKETELALRHSEQQVIHVSTLEQERLGREIHDGLGQRLTALTMMSQSIKRRLTDADTDVVKMMEKLADHLIKAQKEARALARGLAPFEISANGLGEALRALTESTQSTSGIPCTLKSTHSELVHDNRIAEHLYRIAQEALNNAIKHADAKRISITLHADRQLITLSIHDDGKGIQKKNTTPNNLGIDIMHYRAKLIDAQLTIKPATGGGTLLTCQLPWSKRHDE